MADKYISDLETKPILSDDDLFLVDDTAKTYNIKAKSILDYSANTFSNPNLLINGSLQVWQRGTSFNLSTSDPYRAYVADRWLIFRSPKEGNCLVEKDGAWLKLNVKNAGVNAIAMFVDNIEQILGKTLTLSFYAKASEQINSLIYVWNDKGITNPIKNQNIILSSQPQKYHITFTVPEILPDNILHFWFLRIASNQGKTVWISKAKLEIGELATPFIPKSYANELIDCQRYYFRSKSNLVGTPGAYEAALNETSSFIHCNVRYPVQMRVSPTVNIYSIAGNKNKIGIWANGIDTAQTVSVLSSTQSAEGFNCITKGSSDASFAAETYAFHVEADAEIN